MFLYQLLLHANPPHIPWHFIHRFKRRHQLLILRKRLLLEPRMLQCFTCRDYLIRIHRQHFLQ